MATLLRSDGTSETVTPANGTHYSLEELQGFIGGGYAQQLRTKDGRWLLCDEDGKRKGLPYNSAATLLYKYGNHDSLCGDVLLVETWGELSGPEEDDE